MLIKHALLSLYRVSTCVSWIQRTSSLSIVTGLHPHMAMVGNIQGLCPQSSSPPTPFSVFFAIPHNFPFFFSTSHLLNQHRHHHHFSIFSGGPVWFLHQCWSFDFVDCGSSWLSGFVVDRYGFPQSRR